MRILCLLFVYLVFSGLAAVCDLRVVLLIVLGLFMMADGAWQRLGALFADW